LKLYEKPYYEQQTSWPHRSIILTPPHRAIIPVNADADRIGQVITNLLTNALKYSSDGAEVVVTIRTRGEMVWLGVRDQGPGLSAEQQVHLWERFYRVPGIEQLSGSGVGLGLGLNICKTIVERHKGEVGVESAPNAGSTFWFAIPVGGS
jgi:signal transduction histidine kinase